MHFTSRLLTTAVAIAAITAIGASDPPSSRRTTAPPIEGVKSTSAQDQARQLLAQSNQAYRNVRDYSCLFIKRERLRGQLQAENLIDMKVRAQPFSVYMRWLGPSDFEGQQACYVTGRNNGQMRAKSAGFKGIAGFISLDLRDPRVMENNRHTINEAGIGNLIARLSERWNQSQPGNTIRFSLGEYTYNQRPCIRVEAVNSQHVSGPSDYYRTIVYFDKENHLPIRVENYEWPRAGGEPAGALLESYSYVNLQLNIGLKDATFNN